VYRELAVAPGLAGVLEATWVRVGQGETQRVLPDGCTDLMWVDGELVVAGPDTQAQLAEIPEGTEFAAVRFVPGAGPAILGVPGHELRDGRVPLDALWPARHAYRLADQVTAAPDRIAALQAAVAQRLAEPDPVAAAAVSGLSVTAVAQAVGLSERQLHRRCLDAFGYGPKTLARILRFRRAVALARAGTGFAAVAAQTGYADQAHLSREVRALSGVPLGALVG
jgi:AraC-like DNA-binding protein